MAHAPDEAVHCGTFPSNLDSGAPPEVCVIQAAHRRYVPNLRVIDRFASPTPPLYPSLSRCQHRPCAALVGFGPPPPHPLPPIAEHLLAEAAQGDKFEEECPEKPNLAQHLGVNYRIVLTHYASMKKELLFVPFVRGTRD